MTDLMADPLLPQDLHAERSVLGAMLSAPEAIADVSGVLIGAEFYQPAHQTIYSAILAVHDQGRRADAVTVGNQLGNQLSRVGGAPYLIDLIHQVPTVTSASYYAEIVAEKATLRRLGEAAQRIAQLVHNGAAGTDLNEVLAAARSTIDDATKQRTGVTVEDRYADGASFILDAPVEVPAVWGKGDEVLWAEGEALMICGGNGVGKTTIATQVLRARLGLSGDVLGLPVEQGSRRVLYLAMDRPSQIRRAMHRAFNADERDVLADCLRFWQGPPLADLAQNPALLLRMCEQADADTVVVDSLKDAAVGLSADETGAGWNRARQGVLVAGVQVLELHHLVKRNANGGDPQTIADIYGSAWLTAGAGSVILLAGAPGDPVVGFRHLKQPMSEVGPWQVLHDHTRGISTIQGDVDPLDALRSSGQQGISAKTLASTLYDKPNPTAAEVQKARRKLDRLVDADLAHRVDFTGQNPTLYFPAASGGMEER